MDTNDKRQIIIAGAGIGGLTTAIALGQRGFQCALYETGRADRPQGAGLALAPNALEALRRLGLYERVHAVGREPKAMLLMRSDGRILQNHDAAEWRERYGFAPVGITRGALAEVLLAALDRTPVHHETAIASFSDEAEAPLTVTLAGGAGTASGALLVAADGLRSPIRQRLLGPTRFRYAGQTSWRGIADLHVTGRFADTMVEMWGRQRGLRFGFLPVSERQTYWFATMYAKAGGNDANDAAALEGLRHSLAEFVPEVHALLDATTRLIRTDIVDYAPLDSWHKGRVVLTGDAAHATTPNLGQGACQAIESAFVLAQQLSERPLDEALDEFERIRMDKAHWITNASWRFGRLTNVPGPIGRWLRYSLVPRAPRSSVQKQTDRMLKLAF
jgi:2-polyprenyl-6-methoxyphenol hydroxylase-like FAD-dependent oxidoreductase